MTLMEYRMLEEERIYNEKACARIREKIRRARERAEHITTDFHEGGGRSGTPKDKVGEIVAEIETWKAYLKEYEGKVEAAKALAERVTEEIDEPRVRLALKLKYADGKTWYQVAQAIGWGSEDSWARLCERYLAKVKRPGTK
ncbi:MAG: hypothetical protein IKN72_06260 [Clostridia bacterium]|nr:hypothetical protein [Clostridia bacterium]